MKKVVIFLLLILLSSVVYAGPKEDLLDLVNEERTLLGRDLLSFHDDLNTAAQGHSDDMLAQDYFSHNSLDGRTMVDRMNDAGFFGSLYGENIYAHTGVPDPQRVFDGWKASPEHYANMINSNFNFAGIGIAEGNWDYDGFGGALSNIYTMNFGRQTVICSDGETRQCGSTDEGECEYGAQTCIDNAWGDCLGRIGPVDEVCGDGLDNDCDGDIDEFCDCVSNSYTDCFNNDLYWFDSCDRVEDIFEDCEEGCEAGACVVCEPREYRACYDDDIYWFDSCNNLGNKRNECGENGLTGDTYCYNNDVYQDYALRGCETDRCYEDIAGRVRIEDCGFAGCENGECKTCDPQATEKCYNNDVYWYDSCERRGQKKEECGLAGCDNDQCCISHDHTGCYYNDVYWYSSCNNREERKERCAEGCKDGICVVCEEQADFRCVYSDIYWYDSCGIRGEKKEECGRYGCEGIECNPPPCGDNDDDGYIDVNCGGQDCDDTNEQVYPGSQEICNGKDEDCDGIIDNDCKENLIVINPSDYSESDSRRAEFELDVTHANGIVEYKTIGSWRTFCTKIDSCSRTLYLQEGDNKIDFTLNDYFEDEYTASVNIFVDSRKPRLTRQEPRTNSYTKGAFTATYTEDYPDKLMLYILNPETEKYEKVKTKKDCEPGRNKECTINQDVSMYDGEKISYYFELSDKFNTDVGRPQKVTVDITDPDISILSFEKTSDRYERYILEAEISESVELEYSYPGSSRRICSSCDSAVRYFYFRGDVPEYIDIVATDMAGNSDTKRVYT